MDVPEHSVFVEYSKHFQNLRIALTRPGAKGFEFLFGDLQYNKALVDILVLYKFLSHYFYVILLYLMVDILSQFLYLKLLNVANFFFANLG